MVLINLNGTIQLLRWHLGEGGGAAGRRGNTLKYECNKHGGEEGSFQCECSQANDFSRAPST